MDRIYGPRYNQNLKMYEMERRQEEPLRREKELSKEQVQERIDEWRRGRPSLRQWTRCQRERSMSEIRSSWRRTRSEENVRRKRARSAEKIEERRPRDRDRSLSAHKNGRGRERRRVEGHRRNVSPMCLRDRRRSPSPGRRGEERRGGGMDRRGRVPSYGER